MSQNIDLAELQQSLAKFLDDVDDYKRNQCQPSAPSGETECVFRLLGLSERIRSFGRILEMASDECATLTISDVCDIYASMFDDLIQQDCDDCDSAK